MTLSNKYLQQQKSENKLRTLRQILCDMERYRQKARPPTKINIKGAKSVLGIKEHQNRIKTHYDAKRNISQIAAANAKLMECNLICRNCTNQYKTIIKEMNRDKDKLTQLSHLRVNYLQRVDLRKQSSGDIAVDSEYERLQRKYCPDFHLYGVRTDNSQVNIKPNFVKSKDNVVKTNKIVKTTCKLRHKPLKSSGSSSSSTAAKRQKGEADKIKPQEQANLKKGDDTHGDSDKTLTPEQSSDVSLKAVNPKVVKEEEFPNMDQYRVQFKPRQNSSEDIYNKLHPFNSRSAIDQDSKDSFAMKKSSKILIHDCDSLPRKNPPVASSSAAIFTQIGKQIYNSTNAHNKSRNCLSLQKIEYPQIEKIFYHHQQQPQSPEEKPSTVSCDVLDRDEYYERELRAAIIQNGGSEDPTLNGKLAGVIEKALKNKMSWTKIKSIIDGVNQTKKNQILHLLQIQLQGRVYILCTVRTCNFSFLMSKLDHVMHHFRARFVPVLQHFSHCCVIEAIVPAKNLKLPVKQFQRVLAQDAQALNVKKIEVIDRNKGEVCVKCQPSSMSPLVKSMTDRGYHILASDYGFRANKQIVLDTLSGSEYRKFIRTLLALPDIETICDNVLY